MLFRKPKTESERRDQMEKLARKLEQRHPDLEHLRPREVEKGLESGDIVLVDVRSPEERSVSRIPGAVDPEEVRERPEDFAGRKLVGYCTIGGRSSEWAVARRQEGLDAANLRGSILAWTHAGLPLEDPEGEPTKRVHVAGEKWSLQADEYEPVW